MRELLSSPLRWSYRRSYHSSYRKLHRRGLPEEEEETNRHGAQLLNVVVGVRIGMTGVEAEETEHGEVADRLDARRGVQGPIAIEQFLLCLHLLPLRLVVPLMKPPLPHQLYL